MTDPNSIFKKGIYRATDSDGLTDEQRRWAKNLLQGDNLERLNRANKTGRPFRPVPVVVWYEYWWFNGANCYGGDWRMQRVENGQRTEHHYTSSIEAEINRLKAAGFTVREIPMDGAPSLLHSSHGTCVKRKPFSERFQNFDKVKP